MVLAYNGKEIHGANDLSLAVAETKAGDSASLKVLRNGKETSFNVKVGERLADVAENFPSSGAQEKGKLGITVENITPEAARQMHLSSSAGALVTEVRPGGPADEAGVQPGDNIREINRIPVKDAADLVAATKDLKSGDTVRLMVSRSGRALFLAFDPS